MFTHTCPICPTTFETIYSFKKCCCPRCAYIRDKLRTKAGQKMKRSEAIEYYGAVYDDPFRIFRKSKHYHIIQRIAEFCEQHGTNEITFHEFAAENPDIMERRAQLFGAIARSTSALLKTSKQVKSPNGGGKVAVWRLCVPGAGAKNNSETIA